MIAEDYCSSEVIKLLRTKGYPFKEYKGLGVYIPSITHSKAMKWLREQKHIAILPEVHTHTNGFCWAVSIIDLNKPYDILKYFNTFDKYEDSIESALIYACENVI